MENEKSYISTQLCAVLHPIALKVLLYCTLWQNSPKGLILYIHSFSKTLKLTEQEVRMAIQTLLDLKLIDLTNIDNKWRIELNHSQFKKYLKLPLEKAIEHEGFPLSTEVTFDKEEKQPSTDISDMSDKDIKTLLLRLQAQLKEREETRKTLVVSVPKEVDDLPW